MAFTNRTIWTLWLQGFDQAPKPIPSCIASWRFHNFGWTIRTLDAQSLADWIDIRDELDPGRPDVTPQKVSNAARLALLRKYGGVWTDPTVFCRRPLDNWLPAHSSTGFYAFRGPFGDRVLDTWFIAAEAGNPLLADVHECYRQLWRRHRFRNQNRKSVQRLITRLEPILGRTPRRATLWTNPLLLDALGAYPYALFTYIFTRAILGDRRLQQIWEDADPIDWRVVFPFAGLPEAGRLDEAIARIEGGGFPLVKLNHRRDFEHSPFWAPVLERLEATLATSSS